MPGSALEIADLHVPHLTDTTSASEPSAEGRRLRRLGRLAICASLVVAGSLRLAAAAVHPAQPAVGDRLVCVSSSGLACFEASSMAHRWRALRGNYTFAPLVAGSVVLVGSTTGLHALRSEDGSPHWSWNSGRETASPAVQADTVFAAGRSGRIAALGLESGDARWRRRLGGRLYTPAVSGSLVFAGARNGSIYGLHRRTGDTLWTHSLPAKLVSRPVAVPGGVIITAFDGTVVKLADSGRVRWQKRDPAPSFSPTVAGEMLLFGGMDGELRARHRRSGDLLWRSRLPGSLSIPAAARGNRAAVVTPGGALHVIDAGTGDVLARVELPGAPLGSPVPLENGEWRVFFRDAGEVSWTSTSPG